MSELLAVYDGDERVGELEDHGLRRVEAFVCDGKSRRSLGIFANRLDAMRRFPTTRGRQSDQSA